MADDPHWIEHAHLKKGAYGHHSAKQISKDAKKGGLLGKRARLAKTFASLRHRGGQKLYGGK
jgi:hypothetical protein